ncbi:SDR family NAD(P)-dependent oxidoreductase [Streptomyces griseoluteus]|uniref:SDR family NAD(P)-dependent oxidoreductase n=1 Tax=Streptomyces griseoluteus TaxID=29306 RepID=A0A4Z1DLR7_STRGP|nr:SDR family NAD(P)-dependent oxidoreductase [Streptomyces griseoluteus]
MAEPASADGDAQSRPAASARPSTGEVFPGHRSGRRGVAIRGARILVAGATGDIGSALAERLAGLGAVTALAGRDPDRLAGVRERCGPGPSRTVDAWDLDGAEGTAAWAARQLDGLDAVVVCVGVVAFGPVGEIGEAVAEQVMAVNALAPMAILRSASTHVFPGGLLAAVTGTVARSAPAGMADYAAAKAALATWPPSGRRELRRSGVGVLEIFLPHVESGFAGRAVTGTAPALPPGVTVAQAVDTIVEGMRTDAWVMGPAESKRGTS